MATEIILNSSPHDHHSFDDHSLLSSSSSNSSLLSDLLSQYDTLQYNYITMKTTEKFLENLINEPTNCDYDTEEPLPCDEIMEEFQNNKHHFIHEIIEYRKELQRKDQLQEEANDDSDVEGDESVEIENEEELQKELDELEYQLLQFQQESNQLDAQMAEQDVHYESALLELQTIQQENQAKRKAQVTPKKLTQSPKLLTPGPDSRTSKKSCIVTQEQIDELETQEKRLSALLQGLQSLYQIKIVEIEYARLDFDENFLQNGVSDQTSSGDEAALGISLTLAIKNISYTFLFDAEHKLCDIKLHSSNFPDLSHQIPIIDTVKLLCECAPLSPPHDLRHAIFVITSAMSSLNHLKEHIQRIKRRCLVNYTPQEFSTKRKVEITLQNGVTAILRVHECYPYVPNGIHVHSLSGSGGWSEEELANVKKIVNGMCPSLLEDSVDKLMEVLGE